MKENTAERLLPTQEQRCRVRLENDCRALEAAVSRRLRVVVTRFGERVVEIDLLYPQATCPFLDKASGEVEVRRADVLAHIRPNAGNGFPYPLGAPEVRVYFPEVRTDQHVPWSGGLLWFDELVLRQETPPALRGLVEGLLAHPQPRLGIPCLWRTWRPDYDLLFVANQTHRLLTDPGEYSPTDCMNREAALYWAAHKDRLPLEPPIAELPAPGGEAVRASREGGKGRFTLREVE
jgi:hypothetical protein